MLRIIETPNSRGMDVNGDLNTRSFGSCLPIELNCNDTFAVCGHVWGNVGHFAQEFLQLELCFD